MTLKQRLKYFIYTKVPGKAGKMPYFGTYLHFPINSHLFYRTYREGIYENALIQRL